MNNTTTKRNLSLVAVFMAVVLVVGTFAVTTTQSTQTAFAFSKNKKGDENSKNGNTVTIEECKNKGSASGFDTALDQECENLICTHPGNNATCTQEGAIFTPTSKTPTPTPEPTTTTLRVIKTVVCQPTDPNCSLPAFCRINVVVGSSTRQSFDCEDAIGNGVLITLPPGDDISDISEVQLGPPFFDVTKEGGCSGTIAAGQHLTCTITNTEPAPG